MTNIYRIIVDERIDGRDGQTLDGTGVNESDFFRGLDAAGFPAVSLREAQAKAEDAFLGPDDYGMSIRWHVEMSDSLEE